MVGSQAAKTAIDVAAVEGGQQRNDPLPSSQMFVNNLDRSPERMQRFRQLNSHLPHVTRFAAVDGKTVKRATSLEQQIFAEPIFFQAGNVGVLMSNRQLWEMAAGKSEYITVFEDDAIIHKDFAALAPALVAELPHDWDIALWGWNFDAPMSFDILRGVPCLARFSQSDLRKQWQTLQTDTIRPALRRLHYGFGTVAYSLSPAGAKKLLARVFPIKPFLYRLPRYNVEIENLSFDCVLAALYDSLNAYVCVSPLVLTNNDHGASTIQEAWRQRRFWRLRRIKQSLFGAPALPPDVSSFKVTLATDYPKSREYARKYAHYPYSKGDRFRAAREYLKHLLMRN